MGGSGSLVTGHGDSLELLGTHNAPHPSRDGRTGISQGGSKDHHVFRRRPDGENAYPFSQLRPDGVYRIEGRQAPQRGGVLSLDNAVMDIKVHRSCRSSLDGEGVIAGVLQRRAPLAAEIAVGKSLRLVQGRPAADYPPAPRQPEESGDRAGGANKAVVRFQSAGFRGNHVPEQLCRDTSAPQETVGIICRSQLAGLTAGKVYR